MKTQLLLLKSYLAMLLIFAISLISGQTQLVNYSFNNNLNADAGALITESLTYHASGGAVKTPAYNGNMLTTNDAGDYLEFSADTSGQQNLILAFNGDFRGLFISGTWTVSANIGTGGSYVDIDNLTLYSIFNIPSYGNLSVNLPASTENNPSLKIRIRSSFSFLTGNLRIDNVKLSSGSPKIKVYGNVGNVHIPHLSPASVALTTDYGTRVTGSVALSKTFKVRNFQGTSGSILKVDSIIVGGANPEDFTAGPISPIILTVTNTDGGNPVATFTVGFSPTDDGVRSAEVKLYSNSAPSPYIFNVIGTGSSCNFTPGTYVTNTMSATGTQTLPGNYAGSDLIGGIANPGTGNTLNTRLYPDGNLYTSSPTSWFVRNVAKSVEFGALNVSNQKDVSINFRVAAFTTTTNGTSTTNANNGLNNASYITLEVLKSDNTWSTEMRLQGSNATNRYYRNNYMATGVFASNFTGADPNVTVSNGGTLYSTVQLNFQASDIINSLNNNLKFRITAYTNSNNRLWLIDDVKVLTSNSVYKTYTTAGVWSPSIPGPNDKAIIEGHYTVLPVGLSICECEVADDGSVTIPDGRTITVKGKVVNNGNGDNFVVQSGGNLIQVEDFAANAGSITAERYVDDMNNVLTGPNAQVDYVYWSSPVSGQGLQAFSPGTPANRIYRYNEPDDFFKAVNLTTEPNFVPGKGYAIRAESTGVTTPSYFKTYQFKGAPNNGEISVPIFRSPNSGTMVHGYNLIGNPYPSNLNFPRFYSLNSSAIYNTAWFWTNNFYTPSQQGSGYAPNNYAIWNGSGGVPATTRAAADNNPNNPNSITAVPDGYVASGQAFIIRAKNFGADTLTFKNRNGTNSLRVNNPGTFFHKDGDEAINRFWVKLISSDSIVNTQLIAYIDGATDEFENDYDAELLSLSSNAFYSLLGERKLQIQGKSFNFNSADKILLGTNIFKNGSYTIALENPEGIFAGSQNIYLKDLLLNTLTNLNQGSYNFTATPGILEGRFEIVYEPQSTLVVQNVIRDELVIYRSGDNFVLRSAVKNIDHVEIFDMSGRLYKKLTGDKRELTFNASSMSSGIYILKVNRKGEITSKKIIK